MQFCGEYPDWVDSGNHRIVSGVRFARDSGVTEFRDRAREVRTVQPPTWRPGVVDLKQANAARVYDYILGGAHNFAVDRELAREAYAVHPGVREIVHGNRAFLRRATQFCLSEGVRQFVDLGSGLPTAGNVHEVAHRVDPLARVIYVDRDAAAVAHSRAMLAGAGLVDMVYADVCEPDQVMRGDVATRLLDFDQPIALCAVGLLDFIPPNDHPAELLAKYRSMLPTGSYLVLSHLVEESTAPPELARLLKFSAKRGWPVHSRAREEIEGLFAGLSLIDPGLVPVPMWRPDSADQAEHQPASGVTLAGVGRLV